MRIVCPSCGEEPKKGQRHYCKGPASCAASAEPEPVGAKAGGGGPSGSLGTQRRSGGAAATPGVVCASIASLIAKNPALRRSGKALARCGGEDFVAGLLASAVGFAGWHRDPKRALLCSILGQVAEEAAKALQGFWRRYLDARAPRRPRVLGVAPGGYQQLALPAAPASRAPTATTSVSRPLADVGVAVARPPLSGERRATSGEGGRGRPPALTQLAGPGALHQAVAPKGGGTSSSGGGSTTCSSGGGSSSGAPPALPPSPRQPETPRNKSNPRPAATRAVPLNPIHAMRQRKQQQEQEAEEKRLQQLQEAEERRAARGQASQPASPAFASAPALALPMLAADEEERALQALMPSPDTGALLPSSDFAGDGACSPFSDGAACPQRPSAPSTPRGGGSSGAGRPPPLGGTWDETALTPLERRARRQASGPFAGSESPRAALPPSGGGHGGSGEVVSAPATLDCWRPAAAAQAAQDSPRASSSASGQSPSATDRLRTRLRQRAASPSGDEVPAASGAGRRGGSTPGAATSGWKDRIEARQREAVEEQELQTEHKLRCSERSQVRSGAMQRVMERQAQRQQELEQLEVTLEA